MGSISNGLRDAIGGSGETLYALAKRAGVPIQSVSRFVKGERSVSLAVADKLAAALGLELRQARPVRARERRAKR